MPMPTFRRVTRHKSTEVVLINMELVRAMETDEGYTIIRFDDEHSITVNKSVEALLG
jgi:hypothetical protein